MGSNPAVLGVVSGKLILAVGLIQSTLSRGLVSVSFSTVLLSFSRFQRQAGLVTKEITASGHNVPSVDNIWKLTNFRNSSQGPNQIPTLTCAGLPQNQFWHLRLSLPGATSDYLRYSKRWQAGYSESTRGRLWYLDLKVCEGEPNIYHCWKTILLVWNIILLV